LSSYDGVIMATRKDSKSRRPPSGESVRVSSGDLLVAVGDAVDNVRTKTLDLSFNELLDMYVSDELIIHPDFQRLFRWPAEKSSQFIESLIIEMPIPPIYVVEEENGQYELIDGLQRFSSYLHFRGVLRRKGEDAPADPLVLEGCDVVRELNGFRYEDLPTPLQIRLKRMSVATQVLRRESDRRLRYHMFKRLNTGGEPLSQQEVRNATIRLLGTEFNEFIQRMARDESFMLCMDIMTDDSKERMEREECVLRFFAFKNNFSRYVKLITPFLDDYMERMSDPDLPRDFDYRLEEQQFLQTFQILSASVGRHVFSTTTKGGTPGNQFSMAHYDMITQGVQKHLRSLSKLDNAQMGAFSECLGRLKNDPDFRRKTTGGGKNYASAYARTIKFVEDWVGQWLATV
jgi:Protein of unknown function DUF262